MNLPAQKPPPVNLRLRWTIMGMKVGWLSGTALGCGLATWGLLIHQLPGQNADRHYLGYWLYQGITILGMSVLGGVNGFSFGIFFGAVLDLVRMGWKNRRHSKTETKTNVIP
jgi:hypothetical protein